MMAALATVPSRAHLLERALASLRPQVDRVAVYLNGFSEPPPSVLRFADVYVLDPENRGAERKLHWADRYTGVYLSCDDDFAYPSDYAATMVAAVRQWGGRAIVTAHGRQYVEQPTSVHDVVPGSVGIVHQRVRLGHWVNHGGTGAMAWDASVVRVPSVWPDRNIVDMQVALWAQRAGAPMWLIPHRDGWIESLATCDPRGIFRASQAEGHRRRNALARGHGIEHGWKLNRLEP